MSDNLRVSRPVFLCKMAVCATKQLHRAVMALGGVVALQYQMYRQTSFAQQTAGHPEDEERHDDACVAASTGHGAQISDPASMVLQDRHAAAGTPLH
jgi:hypothetical protein